MNNFINKIGFDNYIKAFKKYAVFSGRASSKEFWMFCLFHIIFLYTMFSIGDLFGTVYLLVTIIPVNSIGFRRMHDVNKGGWNIYIPCNNLLLAMENGFKGDNKYGSDPKIRKNK